MKLNLGCGKDIRVGYLNVDLKNNGSSNVIVADISKLDDIVDNNSIEEMVGIHIVEYFTPQELQKNLQHWFSKISSGGTIYLQGFDYLLIANDISYYRIDIINLNMMLFGESGEYRGVYDLMNIISVVESVGFEIIEKGYAGNEFFVRARKNV